MEWVHPTDARLRAARSKCEGCHSCIYEAFPSIDHTAHKRAASAAHQVNAREHLAIEYHPTRTNAIKSASSTTRNEVHTSINLRDMRNRQADFIPINSWPATLQRVSLKVNRLQILLIAQFPFDLVEAGQLVIRRPELFQLGEVR